MNLFLIIYDRAAHELISAQAFGSDYDAAAQARADAQHACADTGEADHEIVLLGAESLDVLRRTHSRYFVSGTELVDQVREAVEQAA
jgi:hypothetical protein